MAIDASLVKKLRDETGSGMMDCKKALSETNGDFGSAKDLLRKRGEAKAAKKAHRQTGEGSIGSYIHHNGKIGVLVEVHTESDFVAKNETFQEFVKSLCMQVAATDPLAIDRSKLPADVVEHEKNILAESEDVLAKPEKIRPKIIEGKLVKFYKTVCLLDQQLVTDESKSVGDLVKEMIAKFGENIVPVRFARFELGETADSGE